MSIFKSILFACLAFAILLTANNVQGQTFATPVPDEPSIEPPRVGPRSIYFDIENAIQKIVRKIRVYKQEQKMLSRQMKLAMRPNEPNILRNKKPRPADGGVYAGKFRPLDLVPSKAN